MGSTQVLDLRTQFPSLKDGLIYLDTAATSLKPRCVVQAISDFYLHDCAPIHRGIYTRARLADERFFKARQSVQHFIGAQSTEEIVFTYNTTNALNLLAHSYCKAFLQPNDAILISEIEHHSNLVPWQMVCNQMGLRLLYVRVTDCGEIDLDHFQELLQQGVKFVSLAHISNITGTIHPVETLVRLAHEVGAKICLDGAQAAAHLPVDVRGLDVDFYAFSSHKIYGPTGVGVLYGKKQLLEQMEPIAGGGDMIDQVTLSGSRWAPLPQKFEAGTGATAEVLGFARALEFVLEQGFEAISRIEEQLLTYALARFTEFPTITLLGPSKNRGGLLSFVVEGVHPLDLATLLDCKKVAIRTGHLCSQPAMARFGVTHVSRLSFGIYNTTDDLDQFFTALTWALRQFT